MLLLYAYIQAVIICLIKANEFLMIVKNGSLYF